MAEDDVGKLYPVAKKVITPVFNAAWLLQHWVRGAQRGRRLAAVTLATVNAGVGCRNRRRWTTERRTRPARMPIPQFGRTIPAARKQARSSATKPTPILRITVVIITRDGGGR